jgi:hypothetical protein
MGAAAALFKRAYIMIFGLFKLVGKLLFSIGIGLVLDHFLYGPPRKKKADQPAPPKRRTTS